MPKCITYLEQTSTFNEDIRKWIRKTTDLKTWDGFNIIPHQAYREQKKAVTTTSKGVYTLAVKNIYRVRTPPPGENHKAINNFNTIIQGMQDQSYKLEGLTQANTVLTSSNSEFMP